jgi:Tol biopolymer transport system component
MLGLLTGVLVGTPVAEASLTATVGTAAGEGTDSIVMAGNDGSGRHVIGPGEWSSLSPDGTRVAVTDYDPVDGSSIFDVLPAAGGPPTATITGLGSATWSPDSLKLVAFDPAGQRLLLIDAATGNLTTLATGSFEGASFSPDSTQIAYVEHAGSSDHRGGALKVIDLATRTARTLRRGVTSPLWGPRAIAISVVKRRPRFDLLDVATVQPDGTHFRQLTRIRSTSIFFGLRPLAWSADGARLLASVNGADGYWLNTYGIDAVRGGARLIARHVEPTALSRDGRYIIGQNGDAECCGYQHTDIVRIPWKGGKPRVLLRHAMSASYSG